MAKRFFKKINETFEVDISAGETLLDAAKKINIKRPTIISVNILSTETSTP